MTQAQAREVALSKMKYHGLIEKGWKFDFNTSKRNFGLCNYRKKTIYLSKTLMLLTTDKAQVDTILHEIAHALTPGQHHNAVWRRVCISIGGNGQRCAALSTRMETPTVNPERVFKYTVSCPTCKKKYYKSRKPKGPQSCGKCDPVRYNERHRLIYKQNY